jgi:hypothetical protein
MVFLKLQHASLQYKKVKYALFIVFEIEPKSCHGFLLQWVSAAMGFYDK